jgi:D-alanyl-D-alanine carboxypeptidase
MQSLSRRRFFSLTARTAAGLGAARLLGPLRLGAAESAETPGIREIDAFVQNHLRWWGAPGLTLGLADREGVLAVRAYGHSDLKAGRPVEPGQLFQIGSITKSFVALCMLQLREEGKLDLNRPVRETSPGCASRASTRRSRLIICSPTRRGYPTR